MDVNALTVIDIMKEPNRPFFKDSYTFEEIARAERFLEELNTLIKRRADFAVAILEIDRHNRNLPAHDRLAAYHWNAEGLSHRFGLALFLAERVAEITTELNDDWRILGKGGFGEFGAFELMFVFNEYELGKIDAILDIKGMETVASLKLHALHYGEFLEAIGEPKRQAMYRLYMMH